MLAAELAGGELPAAQNAPEARFGVSLIAPQAPSAPTKLRRNPRRFRSDPLTLGPSPSRERDDLAHRSLAPRRSPSASNCSLGDRCRTRSERETADRVRILQPPCRSHRTRNGGRTSMLTPHPHGKSCMTIWDRLLNTLLDQVWDSLWFWRIVAFALLTATLVAYSLRSQIRDALLRENRRRHDANIYAASERILSDESLEDILSSLNIDDSVMSKQIMTFR